MACSMGVGCDEYGVCYAAAHGQPDRCGREEAPARYAVKDIDTGHYLVGPTRTPHLHKAHLFFSWEGAQATASSRSNRAYRYTVVPVHVTEAK